MRHRNRLPGVSAFSLLILLIAGSPHAADRSVPNSDESFPVRAGHVLDVDLSRQPHDSGYNELALLVGSTGIQLLTLDPSTGNQRGLGIEVAYPPHPCFPPNPVIGILSKYLAPQTVVILNQDYSLYSLPYSLEPDGTPVVGQWQCTPPLEGGSLGTGATAMTEMPGSAFRDGIPRLFIGNNEGLIIGVVAPSPPPIVERSITLLVGEPIQALAAIPQVGYVALGAATPTALFGLAEDAGMYAVSFERTFPPNPVIGFGVFESAEVPPSPVVPIHLAASNGIDPGVFSAELPSEASGAEPLALYPNPGPPTFASPASQLALGSILFVTADSLTVYYDPNFGYETGFGSCLVNLTGGTWGGCVCCFGTTGNVDCDQAGGVDIGDMTTLIDNLFIGFTPLCCVESANCDGLGGVDIGDLTALIDNLFISFMSPAPCQ